MGSRNRVIYQSESLYVSDDINSTSASTHNELIRVQSANYGFTINRQDVNQYGNLSRIDSLVLESPTVNFDFSYYLSNGSNENFLGFDTKGTSQFVSGFLSTSSGKNFYIITSEEGQDSTTFEDGDPYSVIGIGNSFLSDYTVDLSVGSLPTASVSFEASNINSQNGLVSSSQITGSLPSITPQNGTVINGTASINIPSNTGQGGPTALRPGDISLSFPGFDGGSAESGTISTLSGVGGFHIQSASISIPLSRTPIERVGSKFPFARVVDFPVNATMSVNAVLNTVEAGNLAKMIAGCGGDSNKEVAVTINSCEGDPAMSWTLKGATLDSESWSSSIGSNKAVDLTFGVQIGGIDDIDQGIIFSGSYDAGNVALTPTIAYDADNVEISGIVGNVPDNWNTLLDPVHYLTIGSSTEVIGDSAFQNEPTLSGQLTIPATVRNIKDYAFQQPRFTGIVIEEGITGIGQFAFSRTAAPYTISGDLSIPDSVIDLGFNSFYGLQEVDNVYVGARNIGANSLSYGKFTGLTLGTGVETIGNSAFNAGNVSNSFITSVNNTSTVLKDIGDYAFRFHYGITSFTFNEGLTGIGQYAFDGADSPVMELTGIILPDSVTNIGDYAFNDCKKVRKLRIGSGVTSIGQSAFGELGNAAAVPNIEVEINCPTGSFGSFGYIAKAFDSSKSGIYTITGTYYQDYTGTLTRNGIGIPAGSTFISGTY